MQNTAAGVTGRRDMGVKKRSVIKMFSHLKRIQYFHTFCQMEHFISIDYIFISSYRHLKFQTIDKIRFTFIPHFKSVQEKKRLDEF